MRKIILLGFHLFIAAGVFAQDLDRLRDRAQNFLALRKTGDKARAVQYIESGNRQEFLESRPYPLLQAKMLGLEFSADSKAVVVVFQATMMVPEVGMVNRTGRETWIWDGKDWFLRVEDSGNPFTAWKHQKAAVPAKPVPFELSSQTVDFGTHVQGEVAKATIDFKASRGTILAIRVTDLTGMTMVPSWTSDEGGKIEVLLDTCLHSKSIDHQAELHVVDLAQSITHIPITLKAAIEPRLRFEQSPPLLNPAQAGVAELRIENLSDTPFELVSASPTNERYRVVEYTPGKIVPGQFLKIVLAYESQVGPEGTGLNLKLSEPLLTRTAFTVPLNIKPAPVPASSYTKEQLDDLARKARR
jgi:hypothetical protein